MQIREMKVHYTTIRNNHLTYSIVEWSETCSTWVYSNHTAVSIEEDDDNIMDFDILRPDNASASTRPMYAGIEI